MQRVGFAANSFCKICTLAVASEPPHQKSKNDESIIIFILKKTHKKRKQKTKKQKPRLRRVSVVVKRGGKDIEE